MENRLEKHILTATEILEQQVDAQIEQLENLKEDDVEELRRRRLDAMKKAQIEKNDWLKLGHGKYEEIADEKEFFEVCKKSKNVVCHFYRSSTFYCKIFDKHLEILALKHIEAKFVKINAERCQFLVERLRIKVMPTICLIREQKSVDYVVGLTDLGGREDFTTDIMEWRLGKSNVIRHSGDPAFPPPRKTVKAKTIRSGVTDGSSSDED